MLLRVAKRAVSKFWLAALGVVVLQLGQALAQLYLPTLNARIIDEGVAKGDLGYIWSTGAVMLTLALGQAVLAIGAVYCGSYLGMRTGQDLRTRVFERVSSFSQKEIAQFSPGSLITRSTNDVNQMQLFFGFGSIALVSAPIMSIGGILMALRENVGLGWLMGISIPLLLAITLVIISKMVPLFRSYQDRIDAVNLVLREQLTGIRVLRAFVREDTERTRFAKANEDMTDVSRRVGQLFIIIFPLIMFVLNATVVAIYWFGGHQIEAGTTQIGTLVAYMTYMMLILTGILNLSFMSAMIPRAAVSAERICEVLDTDTSLEPPENGGIDVIVPGQVAFENVTFAYPGADEPVLDGLDFEVTRGQTLAFIGSTGAGKTTVANLIPRLYDATGGTVRVGGVDVRKLAESQLSKTLGYVPQNPYLFAGTVRSNMLFGNPDASEEQIWRALELAEAAEFVRDMPKGLDSPIGQGGSNVSGGQRQRLCIARAIVHEPDVFIFDDSFSALDLTTDARVREKIWTALPQATKIVIAQRVSTITQADQIIVLEAGRVVGRGTHEHLLEHCKAYREIVDSQIGVEA